MTKNSPKIDPNHSYSASEAAPLMDLTTADSVKKKCRENEIDGIQKGKRKKWYVKGSEILKYRKRYNLD
jgi:hypothetical protein